MSYWNLPKAGADGTYTGSCSICLTGTDTGLAFQGDAEWAIAGIMHLGVKETGAADEMVRAATGSEPGKVPDGEITVPVRVCADCAGKADMEVGLVATGVPAYAPKE